ncbi:MAG TPA: hypothetical protein DD643_01455 [Synechococcus sp. UBA8638]|nr:hypothetical protein [Synechococcus sp. UBA8638]
MAVLLAPMSPVLAPSVGEFSMVLSSTYNYTNLKQNGTVFTAGGLQGSAAVTSSSGPLFHHGQSLLRSCVVFSERSQEDGGDGD